MNTKIFPKTESKIRQLIVPPENEGMGLVTWLIREIRTLSKAQINRLIYDGKVRVDGRLVHCDTKIRNGEHIEMELPPPVSTTLQAQAIPLAVLHEDADIIVINKAAGQVVHPVGAYFDGTLANALIHRCPDMVIGNEIRPGLVHRLDRYTSGVLVVAKNARAMAILARQFKRRSVQKEYFALVWGRPDPPGGTIESLIGPDSDNPKRMSATPREGRPAITHYTTEQSTGAGSLLRVRIETGRTHQIRVHLAHLGHPVMGDLEYGRDMVPENAVVIVRQMLHAYRIRIQHPATNDCQEYIAPMPEDMQALLGKGR